MREYKLIKDGYFGIILISNMQHFSSDMNILSGVKTVTEGADRPQIQSLEVTCNKLQKCVY